MRRCSPGWFALWLAGLVASCASRDAGEARPTSEIASTSSGAESPAPPANLSAGMLDARTRLLTRCEEREEGLAVRAGRPAEHTRHHWTSSRRRMNGVAAGYSPDVDRGDQPPSYTEPSNDPSGNRTHLQSELEALRLAMDAVADARSESELTVAMQTLRDRCDADTQ